MKSSELWLVASRSRAAPSDGVSTHVMSSSDSAWIPGPFGGAGSPPQIAVEEAWSYRRPLGGRWIARRSPLAMSITHIATALAAAPKPRPNILQSRSAGCFRGGRRILDGVFADRLDGLSRGLVVSPKGPLPAGAGEGFATASLAAFALAITTPGGPVRIVARAEKPRARNCGSSSCPWSGSAFGGAEGFSPPRCRHH